MSLLKKLPGHRRSPPGLEWWLLRRMHWWVTLGTLGPVLLGVLFWLAWPGSERTLWQVWYALAGLVLVNWTLLMVLLIGCVIVWIMKGPAYVADAYPLDDRDKPR